MILPRIEANIARAEMALLSYHAAEARGIKALAGEGHVDGSSSPSQSSASPATRSGR